MLAGDQDASIPTAEWAIELAEAFDAQAPRASALITRATARASVGDYANVVEDLEEARGLTVQHDPTEVSRAYINLSSILLDLGDLAGAMSAAREGLVHNADRLRCRVDARSRGAR